MARLFTNKTLEPVEISYGNRTQVILAESSYDLSLTFKPFELAACDGLLVLLAQGTDKYQLNDGLSDLSVSAAIDLIRGYTEKLPRQPDEIPLFAEAPRDGSEWVIGSHNFCDPCTWFGESVRVSNETLMDGGDGLMFMSANVNWVDMTSGRMHNDDIWVEIQKMMNPSDPHGYAVVVKVDGVEVDRCPDFSETGGDYWVDHSSGRVVFLSSQAGKTVTASYSYATSNVFRVAPMPGKMLIIEDAECDISVDAHMNQAIVYSAWHFDGQDYVLDMAAQYKRASQINTEARGCYPLFTAVGASDAEKQISDIQEFRRKSRGMKYARQGAPFQYATAKKLHSRYGQEVRVFTSDGVVMPGEHVTITFYCLEQSE